jgi:hypothetical protein
VSLTEPPPLPQASRLRWNSSPAPSHRLELRDHASRKPNKALASLIGLCEADAFDRHCASNGVKRLLGDGDLDHVGDIGLARANRQNSPRAREVSNAGATHFAGQDSKGTPSRLGAPRPVVLVASPMPTVSTRSAPGLLFAVNGSSLDCHPRPSQRG